MKVFNFDLRYVCSHQALHILYDIPGPYVIGILSNSCS